MIYSKNSRVVLTNTKNYLSPGVKQVLYSLEDAYTLSSETKHTIKDQWQLVAPEVLTK